MVEIESGRILIRKERCRPSDFITLGLLRMATGNIINKPPRWMQQLAVHSSIGGPVCCLFHQLLFVSSAEPVFILQIISAANLLYCLFSARLVIYYRGAAAAGVRLFFS